MVGEIPLKSQTILLVEDEWLMRWSLERTLRQWGFEVITAGNGYEALNILAHRPADWLISDHKMPDIDGLELLHRTQYLYPQTRLALITAYCSPSVQERARQLGIPLFQKPLDLSALQNFLQL